MKGIRTVIFVIILIISLLSTSELKSLGKSKIKSKLKSKSLNLIKQTGKEGANKDGTVETNLSPWEAIRIWFSQW